MKNLVVYKPNQLIEIVGNPITTQGLMAYNFILHKFQQSKTDKIIISMSEIFNSLEMNDKYEELSAYLDSLLRITVTSKDSKGKIWGGFNLLSEFKKVEGGVFIQIPNTIFQALCGNEKEKEIYYTTIKLLEQRVYRCSYTIIFYELFKKFEKVNLPIYTLEELKEITGTREKYKEYKYFKRDVLIKGLEELNQFESQYEYSFEEKKLGRKVNEIKFLKKDKYIINLNSEYQISEKLLNAIIKARQNRFIDLSYSQKAMEKIVLMYDEKDIIKGLNELYKYNSEILNFSKILISKISDIKASKQIQNQIPTKSPSVSIPTLTIDLVEPQKVLIEISKDDYEILYQMFLNENQTPNLKSVRSGFDKMNKNKYKII